MNLKHDFGAISKSISSLEKNEKRHRVNGKNNKLVKRKKLSYHRRQLQRNLKNSIDSERSLKQELDLVNKAYVCLD